MPFKSDAQRRFMYAKHPVIAERWQEHTPKGKDLPEKVSDKSKEKAVETVEKEAAVLGYRLGRLKRADLVPGGQADNKPDSDFPPKALQQGAKVEAEHSGNSQLAREIAKDHLSESTDYYTRLKKMESQMKQDKAAAYGLGRSLFVGRKQAEAEKLEEKRAYGKLMSLLYRAARSGVKGTGDTAAKIVGKVSPKAQKVLNTPIVGGGAALGGAGQTAANAARLTDKAKIDRMANETINKMMAG